MELVHEVSLTSWGRPLDGNEQWWVADDRLWPLTTWVSLSRAWRLSLVWALVTMLTDRLAMCLSALEPVALAVASRSARGGRVDPGVPDIERGERRQPVHLVR